MEAKSREKALFNGRKNPIHHVIYIIKENRTYDQIFGDLKPGNGDPSLCMYGEDITPNQHALAKRFGVIDNFYCSGEVSGDGHVWSMRRSPAIITNGPGRLDTEAVNGRTTLRVKSRVTIRLLKTFRTLTIRGRDTSGRMLRATA